MFKELFADDNERGVSPVIGVILMVAITVILAAVIGAFVLGLGDQVSNNAPQASFSVEFNGTHAEVTHNGGDNIEKGTLNLTSTNTSATDIKFGGDPISTGDTETINATSGNTVRVVWQNPSGGSSNILAERTAP